MPANNPHVKALVEAGLDRRPMRSLSELLAEHRELAAVLDRLLNEPCPNRQYVKGHPAAAAAEALLARVRAPTADRSAA